MRTALTIAGCDPSGGAGVGADIKTMTANGVYAMSVITALTAQNTLGVTGILETPPEFLQKQLDAVFSDIRPDAVKIGMLPSAAHINVIANTLERRGAANIVVDPVMISTSGSRLMDEDAISTLTERLLPLSTVLTPNIPEGELLAGMKIETHDDMISAARIISGRYRCAVLLKGGHGRGGADDLLFTDGMPAWFRSGRITNPNTHGTGCTLSSAVASNLAKGYDLHESVKLAKDYITGAISSMLSLGHGRGPLDHTFDLHSRFISADSINSER